MLAKVFAVLLLIPTVGVALAGAVQVQAAESWVDAVAVLVFAVWVVLVPVPMVVRFLAR